MTASSHVNLAEFAMTLETSADRLFSIGMINVQKQRQELEAALEAGNVEAILATETALGQARRLERAQRIAALRAEIWIKKMRASAKRIYAGRLADAAST